MTDTSIPEVYKSDHLFLLVGMNPLPNYVAVQLMAADGATLYLLHSKTTFDIAQRLKASIEAARSSFQVIPREINETDGQQIERQVRAILNGVSPKPAPYSVGLNYTGGTKPMAVHSYRVIKQAFPLGIFSYLDAGSLRMFIAKGDEPTQSPIVGAEVTLGLEELMKLHGYKLAKPPAKAGRNADLSHMIALVHSTPDSFKQWRNWIMLPDSTSKLSSLLEYPALASVWQFFQSICGGSEPTESKVAQALGASDFKGLSKYFIAEWLEEYALEGIGLFAEEIGINHYGMNLLLRQGSSHDFELDVAAMYGYQLFAISCTATEEVDKREEATKPGRAKEHLMEAFVRARQLGGDEARYGVVSCVQNPAALQREIEQQWDAEGKVWVFGMYDLPYLAERLKLWFTTANKERR